jgi:hypothetical protein
VIPESNELTTPSSSLMLGLHHMKDFLLQESRERFVKTEELLSGERSRVLSNELRTPAVGGFR